MLTLNITDVNGNVIATVQAFPKNFKTGSRGYNASGKVAIEGKKHQVSCNFIEVGSKKESKGAEEA